MTIPTIKMKMLFCFIFMLLSFKSFSQTQMELNETEAKNYKVQDAKLNKAYKKLMNLLETSKEKDLLLKAQRLWISYRDGHCAFVKSAYDGGSMQPMIYFGCMTEITKQRIKELTALLAERSPK